MLNEPGSEKELRLPIERWLKKEGFQVDIEVPYKIGKRKRVIDLVGWKKIGYLSRSVFSSWVDQEFIAIESKIRASRSAIDKAFSQASDYMKCAQYTFVAISPYIFLKYSDIINDKIERHDNIGILLVDKSRVIQVYSKTTETKVDRESYEEIKKYLEI